MGLFQKDEDRKLEVASLYTFGASKTRLFIGLGNPGEKYVNNRHNAGFMVLDAFAEANDTNNWVLKKDLKAYTVTLDISGTRVILAKPQTFMNNSGEAAQAIMSFFKLPAQECTVFYDEIDLPLGVIGVKKEGGAAGHNGIKSLLQHIGEDFTRVRIGIGPKTPEEMELADFVLQNFNKSEQETLKSVIKEASGMISEATASDLSPQKRTV